LHTTLPRITPRNSFRHVIRYRSSTAVRSLCASVIGMKAIQSIVKSANALQRVGQSKATRYKGLAATRTVARAMHTHSSFSMPDSATELLHR
jgi:hypothetical protein